MAAGQLTGVAVPVFLLVNQLSRQLGRSVIDKTGLAGKYDFTLQWEPDSPAFTSDAPTAADSSGPTIFTALEQDLGLKLQSAKGPVNLVVIDRVEKTGVELAVSAVVAGGSLPPLRDPPRSPTPPAIARAACRLPCRRQEGWWNNRRASRASPRVDRAFRPSPDQ